MCASWSGQKAAVRLLLQHGAAWVGVVDTNGRDAKDLALEGITRKLSLATLINIYVFVCLYSAQLTTICSFSQLVTMMCWRRWTAMEEVHRETHKQIAGKHSLSLMQVSFNYFQIGHKINYASTLFFHILVDILEFEEVVNIMVER